MSNPVDEVPGALVKKGRGTKALSPEEWQTRIVKAIDAHLEAIRKLLRLGARKGASAADIRAFNRKYGRDILRLVDGARITVTHCPEPFSALGDLRAGLTSEQHWHAILTTAQGRVAGTAQEIQREAMACCVNLGEQVRLVSECTDATLRNPATGKRLREQLTRVSQHLRQRVTAREAQLQKKGAATQRSSQLDAQIASQETELQRRQTQDRVRERQKDLTLQYMSGMPLRPDDLLPPEPPPETEGPPQPRPRRSRGPRRR